MKKLKNIVIMIILAVAAFACTDVLDKGPLDKYSENDVWKSTDLTQAFIYTALKNATDMMIWKDNWTDNEAILEDGRNINFELIWGHPSLQHGIDPCAGCTFHRS